ncbi:TAP-like protein [Kribbella sp. VKM Ac-2568]|nr:TAP-like protein [Kribbella sp. VKM Ac-2568]
MSVQLRVQVRFTWFPSFTPKGREGGEVIATMDLRDDLPSISIPTLAIAGADDPATPVPHLQAIAESVQNGQLLVVPQSAHLANDEQPEIITEALLAHLRVGQAIHGRLNSCLSTCPESEPHRAATPGRA